MCGRYSLKNAIEVKKRFGVLIRPDQNVAPSKKVLVLDQSQKIVFLHWGYSPVWAKKPFNLINARSETLNEKISFKNAMRCVFVADGWYEWKKECGGKYPYFHHLNGELIFFGGIYNLTSGCAIVTRRSHDKFSSIHHRQPVLLGENDLTGWLLGENLFGSSLTEKILYSHVSKDVFN